MRMIIVGILVVMFSFCYAPKLAWISESEEIVSKLKRLNVFNPEIIAQLYTLCTLRDPSFTRSADLLRTLRDQTELRLDEKEQAQLIEVVKKVLIMDEHQIKIVDED